MKRIVPVMVALLSLVGTSPVTPPAPSGSSALGVFVGTSPCADVARPLLKIPPGADCDRMKWNLTLYQDPNTLTPTTYKLNSEYGFHIDNRTYVSKGMNVGTEGRWAVVRGARTDPDEVVFRLDPDKPQLTISFLKVDHNILHLLDRDKSLLVGNAAQSYTLSRSEKASPPASSPVKLTAPTIPASSAANGSPVPGVFEGRSPCREIARELNIAERAECIKIKWRLTLYQDPNKLIPTTYKLEGTTYREAPREGTWTIVRGSKTDPGAVVYQLDPDKPQGSLFFLKGDDKILFFLDKERNLLVGNGDFSYTLNKVSKF